MSLFDFLKPSKCPNCEAVNEKYKNLVTQHIQLREHCEALGSKDPTQEGNRPRIDIVYADLEIALIKFKKMKKK